MAVPKNASILRGSPLKTGVMLGLSPSSDPTFDMELARATSSGVYETIATLSPKGEGIASLYTDLLPQDNRTWYYKGRAVKTGYLAGSYTTAVTAKAVLLPEVSPNVTPLTGKGIGAALFVSTGAPPKYGNVGAAASYDKTFAVYPFEFSSTLGTVGTVRSPSRLYPTTPLVAVEYYAPVPLPANASVDTVSFQYRRNGVVGAVRFRLQTVSPSTATATAIDYTATGTAGTFTKTFSSGFTVGNVPYFARVTLTSTDGTAASVYLNSLAFTYGQSNLAVGL